MKKLLLTLMLAVVSSSAMAEWVVVSRNEDAGITVYANPTSIRKSGDIVKMWILIDSKEAQVNKVMSLKVQYEYNCKEELTRSIYEIQFSENMGKGKTIAIFDKPKDWSPTPPDSMDEGVWKIACGK